MALSRYTAMQLKLKFKKLESQQKDDIGLCWGRRGLAKNDA